ncbi:hypothetical protein GSVR_23550 [Geobacter sp. SVR]|nr:hypothetical protein GSVR_23550 [Geobacter sp. SVR]
MKIIDEVYVKELTEINYAQIAYNNTALLGVKIRATDQLSGQPPTITTLVKGTKIAIPSNMEGVERYNADGSYNAAGIQAAYAAGWTDGKLTWDEVSHTGTKYWSDNPVWCLYDLLTNRRYGLGQYYPINPDKLGLMQAQFYLMAKYCDEPVEYIDSTGATDVVKYRPRFALNIVLDQTKSAAEWVSQICTCMRAVPFYSEGIFWIDIDRPKLPTQIFNMSNIKDYSQAGTSYRQIPNCMEVQYINPLQNYEIDSFRLESKELQNNPQLEERTKALMLVGVTNFDQAKALTKFTLLAAQNRAKMVTFKAGSDVIRSMVTDVIGIQHDVPQNGYGGKVVAVEEDGTVTLSEPVTFDSLMSYYITLSDAAAVSETVQIYPTEYGVPCSTISPISVTSNTGEPYVANPGNNYIIGIASNSVALYRIASLKRDQDAMCEVTAVDYYEDLYTAADSTKDMGILVIPNYSLLQNPLRSSVTGVTASPKIYQDSTGSWKVGVDVFYDPPKNNSFWKGAMLYYAKSGTTNYQVLPENSKGSFLIPDITDPGQYTFIVTSTYTSGKQTVDDALNDMQRHPWTTEYINIYLPNDAFLEGVIALGIENQANDGTFLGKDCIVTWKRPAAIDAILSTSAGDETLGAGVDSAGEWFKEYQIEVRGLDGTTRRTLRQLSERFVYTHEMNYEDGITRSFTVTVIAYDRLGRSSAPKTITCSNPAPPAIS